jgi:hypothetical protein
MNIEYERMLKEVVMAKFKVLSWHLPGGIKKNRENSQLDKPVSRPKTEHETL